MVTIRPLTGAASQLEIDTSGLIHKQQWIVTTWAMCSLALITVGARIGIRFFTRRKLFLDDYFLIMALACVIVATSALQWGVQGFFVYNALTSNAPIVPNADDLKQLTRLSMIGMIFQEFTWTAIFFVKFSFLALFRVIIRNVSMHLSRYFWCVVVVTTISWALNLALPFIMCMSFGLNAVSNCTEQNARKLVPLTILFTVFDMITDVLVVTFPVVMLRKARINKAQKLGLGVFLSLSIVMILVAIIRLSGTILPGETTLDVTWESFWLMLEADVALLAASCSVFRTIFLRQSSPPRHAPLASSSDEESTVPPIPALSLTRPMVTEIRSFIQRERSDDVEFIR